LNALPKVTHTRTSPVPNRTAGERSPLDKLGRRLLRNRKSTRDHGRAVHKESNEEGTARLDNGGKRLDLVETEVHQKNNDDDCLLSPGKNGGNSRIVKFAHLSNQESDNEEDMKESRKDEMQEFSVEDMQVSSKADIQVSSKEDMQVSSKVDIQVSSKEDIQVSSKEDMQVSSKVDIQVSSKEDMQVSSKEDSDVNLEEKDEDIDVDEGCDVSSQPHRELEPAGIETEGLSNNTTDRQAESLAGSYRPPSAFLPLVSTSDTQSNTTQPRANVCGPSSKDKSPTECSQPSGNNTFTSPSSGFFSPSNPTFSSGTSGLMEESDKSSFELVTRWPVMRLDRPTVRSLQS